MAALPSLKVVDQAFGPHADLYNDVLHVKPSSASEEIQRAYFDRRNDLFRMLSDLEEDSPRRLIAERKMDAVVLAGRVLGDAEMRTQYDQIRRDRLAETPPRGPSRGPPSSARRAASPKVEEGQRHRSASPRVRNIRPAADPPTAETSPRGKLDRKLEKERAYRTPTKLEHIAAQSAVSWGNEPASKAMNRYAEATKSLRSTPDTAATEDDDEDDQTQYSDQSATVYTEYTDTMTVMTPKTNAGLVESIQFEVMGAIDDTARSLSEVLNVFTLKDDDIRAVCGRIDKAKKQMGLE